MCVINRESADVKSSLLASRKKVKKVVKKVKTLIQLSCRAGRETNNSSRKQNRHPLQISYMVETTPVIDNQFDTLKV